MDTTKPLVLASNLLLEEIAPLEPGKRALRIVAIGLGGSAFFGTLISGAPLTVAFAWFVVAIVGLVPLEYNQRSWMLSLIALGSLALSGIYSSAVKVHPGDWLLFFATVVMSSSLLFRASHRASKFARSLVIASSAVGWSWVLRRSRNTGLLVLSDDWLSWAPFALRVIFVILLLLSLLALMGPTTTGGCRAWATALLSWFAIERAVAWYEYGTAHALHLDKAEGFLAASIAAATLLASISTWHMLVVSVFGRRDKWRLAVGSPNLPITQSTNK